MPNGYEIYLLDRIRNSDSDSFELLYEKEWKSLYTLAFQKTGSKDDAADLVQNVFTDFWDSRKKIPAISSIHGYLRGIMVHKIARYFRTKGFSQKHLEDFKIFSAETRENEFISKELERSGTEILDFVSRQIDSLPERMRQIFVLSCSREYSVAEIAEIFSLSPQTVKNQVSNALSRIRNASGKLELSGTEVAIVTAILLQ